MEKWQQLHKLEQHTRALQKKWKLGGNGRNDTKEKCIYVWMLAYNDTTTIFCGTFSCGKRKIGHSPVYFSANKLAIVRHCLLITFHQMFVLFFQQKNPLTPRKNGREKNLTKQFFFALLCFSNDNYLGEEIVMGKIDFPNNFHLEILAFKP